MGASKLRTDFEWSYTEEPHASRRKEILKKYPEIKMLIGHDPSIKWKMAGMMLLQFALMFMVKDQTWPIVLLVAYCLGGTLTSNSLLTAVHEINHNLAFGYKNMLTNKLVAMLGNLPLVIPFALSFRKYHILHHRNQGDETLDTDIPTYFEAKMFRSRFGKFLWICLQPVFYILRPLFIYPNKVELLEIVNAVIQITFDVFIYQYFGGKALAYLMISPLFSLGLHPLGGRVISEHCLFNKDYETYSYYGPLNWITFNIGYHNEHHDFPFVPGSRLPEVKRIAAEYYDNLPHHTSLTKVLWDFVMDPNAGPYARIRRKPHGLSD